MKDFVSGIFVGGFIVAAVYLGWVHFEFELFGIIINSTQFESENNARCREELKRANQRAFASDKIAQQMRNRALIAEQQLHQIHQQNLQSHPTNPQRNQQLEP
ncbi:M48 family metalloprotease [Laspinema sp. D1]|uniref:M48 family metalloprotease n=1 Tax=Laspinema palackyanum D2a TaxID=2953684 RepID=A0ABT2MJY7_9CYAN|nr:M48 family metalloprotease [Laspinema sp. D2a]